MKRVSVLFLAMIVIISGCKQSYTASEIIEKSIQAHGGNIIDIATISFKLRDSNYQAIHHDDKFKYERWTEKDGRKYHDVYTDGGFQRSINMDQINVEPAIQEKYSNSINSVIYFALLPYKLDDPAVNATLIGETEIKDEPYYEIKVTFDEKGGGEDHEDVFTYWIHRKKFTVDYLAYLYHTDGGGTRFREAFNQRQVNGVFFNDYKNYSGPFPYDVTKLDSLFQADELEMVSTIVLEDVEVK